MTIILIIIQPARTTPGVYVIIAVQEVHILVFHRKCTQESHLSLFNGVSLANVESLSVESSSGKAWSLTQVHMPFVKFRDYQVIRQHSMPAST